MAVIVRAFQDGDVPAMTAIWNQVVEDGVAFPQTQALSEFEAARFFAEQDFTAVAADEESGQVLGLYILHPNNVGRCGHIANASYAVDRNSRGRHVGRLLVGHSLRKAKELNFALMQFNAVVVSNHNAIHLYESLGFVRIGMIPGGFHMKDGSYEDIILFYHQL